jgi:hypothetical protein
MRHEKKKGGVSFSAMVAIVAAIVVGWIASCAYFQANSGTVREDLDQLKRRTVATMEMNMVESADLDRLEAYNRKAEREQARIASRMDTEMAHLEVESTVAGLTAGSVAFVLVLVSMSLLSKQKKAPD